MNPNENNDTLKTNNSNNSNNNVTGKPVPLEQLENDVVSGKSIDNQSQTSQVMTENTTVNNGNVSGTEQIDNIQVAKDEQTNQVVGSEENNTSQVVETLNNVNNVVSGENENQVNNQVQPTPGVIAPSTPVNGLIESNNVNLVQNGAPLKKKKNYLPLIGIGAIVIVVLGLLGYFVIYPTVSKKFSNSKEAYTKTLNEISKNINSTLSANSSNSENDKFNLSFDLAIDSNVELLKIFKDYKISGIIGVDNKNSLMEFGYGIRNKTDDYYGQNFYLKNNKYFTKYSTNRDLIYSNIDSDETVKVIFESANQILQGFGKVNTGDISYIATLLSKIINDNISEKDLSKSETSLKIGNENVKVLSHQMKMDKDKIINLYNSIRSGLAEDAKFVNIYAEMNNLSVENAKKAILGEEYEFKNDYGLLQKVEKAEELDIPDDYNITINVYTYGTKMELIGFDFSDSDDNKINSYKYNGNFEVTFEVDDDKAKITGKKAGNITNVDLEINEEVVASIDATEFSTKSIVGDYKIFIDKDETLTGHLDYKMESSNEKATYNFAIKVNISDEEYINVDLKLTNDWTSEVANVNDSSSVTLNEQELNNVSTTYFNALMENTFLKDLVGVIAGGFDSNILDYYTKK